jgi:hypothetical protein
VNFGDYIQGVADLTGTFSPRKIKEE